MGVIMKSPKFWRNKSGFVQIIFLGLLPILVTAFYSLFLQHQSTRIYLHSQSVCRHTGLKIQEKISQQLNKVLSLNPLAQSLQIKLKISQIQLAAAVGALNLPAIIRIETEIKMIKSRQRRLDSIQNSIIQKLREIEASARNELYIKLNNISTEIAKPEIRFFKPPQVPLVPKGGSPGPVYELNGPVSDQAALVLKWQARIKSRNLTNNYITTGENIEGTCGASIKQINFKWQEALYEDKY